MARHYPLLGAAVPRAEALLDVGSNTIAWLRAHSPQLVEERGTLSIQRNKRVIGWSVSEDNVLRLLGKMSETGSDTPGVNPFRTIMFTDLQGSTSMLESVGQSAFMVLLTEHDLIIRRTLVAAHGREVKHTGDGFMAAFDDVASALGCSIAIQTGFEARSREGLTPELRVRIGIAAGEPVDHNDDLFGSTVTLASRICGAANAGCILTSDLVHDLGSERGFAFDGGRDVSLKGISGPTRVFELVRSGS